MTQAVTWNDFPSIHDVEAVDSTDEACLAEMKSVLERHGKTKRFGVTLLHQHFALGDEEVLVEHCDLDARRLTTEPQAATDEILGHYIPTVWRFDGHVNNACQYCPTHGNQHDGHKDNH
jgi:hypothetical protein